uniref:DHC_N1 domain-containing protein n=1 Tax=Angiostrongylus cantonensis TaxID=6313 RepID=A0A0K0D3H1_ANGCA
MALHLHSIAAHFEQYLPAVELKIREAREPAEQSLRDYVKIVKYNDLSLWNIKVSSQKARTHLYKIVRKFREALSVQTSSIFDTLVPMSCANIPVAPCLAEVNVGGRVHKARQLAEDICVAVTKLCEITGIVQLAEQAKSCDEAVRTQINYRGEDSEKEKQQGYARNSRQRLVAVVIKELQALGLNARKAAVLNREVLTRSSLTEVASHRAEELSVRKCAGGRNACIRKSLLPNNQLGVATRRHLEGVVDYGMSWIMKCHKTLVDWEEFCALFTRKTHALERIQSNAEVQWGLLCLVNSFTSEIWVSCVFLPIAVLPDSRVCLYPILYFEINKYPSCEETQIWKARS